ncbi:ATP-binding protein [archaeon]|nr:ATP-binding protein [archaeon]PJC45164.1 MAG: AAA family ATPase [Candidatus Pacearchaeota archaeon CG_4_9_14_0_2_um_filter_30_8]
MEITKTILNEWKERNFPEILIRDFDISKYVSSKLNKILVLNGFRRVGKTYILLNEINELLKKYSKKEIVYLNFEDERIPLKKEFLSELIPEIIKLNGEMPKFLFLDEIQNFPEWSKWLRRVYDLYPSIRFFVTGSSSKMSLNKIPTELRGRYLLNRIFPLSFREFLKFKGFNEEINQNKLINLFEEYLVYGGLPEVVLSEKNDKLEIAKSYYSSVVNRDLIEIYNIRNKESMKAILNLLVDSTSYSYNKMYNSLKSLQYEIGKNTLIEYINFIEDSFFMFSLSIFSYKVKDRMQYPKKNYFIDNIFLSKISTNFSNNYGRFYENLVAINLLKREDEFFYWRNEKNEEVDFVIKKGKKVEKLIQVCYDLKNSETFDREIRALLKASKDLKCKNLVVINKDREEVLEKEWFGIREKIKFVPLWKWCLE